MSDNVGTAGGGIWNNGWMTLTNSTVSGNSVLIAGGGIYNHVSGTLRIAHTILANNLSESSGPDCINWGTLESQDYNLVENTTNCLITGNTVHNIYGQDPLLGPLQDNGGPTWTHGLLPGSPVIDAGDNATCPAYDQRGLTRPRDGDGDGQAICDIGAFELQDVAITGLTASNDSPTALGQPTNFTATVMAGTNVTYSWDFGDGAAGSGAVASHIYGAVGPYTTTVTAANTVSSDTAETPVSVEEAINDLLATNDSPTILGQPTTFTATVTAGTNVTYSWDFGDSTAGSGAVVSNTFAAAGPYTVTVTAANLVSSATAETPVMVEEVISGLAAVNDSPTVLGQPTTFTATITAGTNITYSWDFGDDAAGSGAVVSHTYAAAGPYTATISAANLVSTAMAETEATVEEAISGLSAASDSPTILGQPTAFTATITAGTNVTYSWDFGDGGSGSGTVVSHTYAAAGPFTATVTAANTVGSAAAGTAVIVEPPIWPVYLPMIVLSTGSAIPPAGVLPIIGPVVLAGLILNRFLLRRKR